MKRVALITVIVLLVITFLVIVWRLQNVVYVFLLSLVIAMSLERPIDLLTERGAPRWLAVLALYGASLLMFVAIALFVLTPVVQEVDPFVQEILNEYGLLENRLARLANGRRGILIATLPTTESVAAIVAANSEGGLGTGLIAGAQRLLGIAGELALAVVVAIYWSMDSTRFERLWLSLLAPLRRSQARRFFDQVERSVGAYIRSELLQTLLAGALLTALYAVIGIPYPFLLATLVALTWLIPIVGGALAFIIAAIVGWFVNWSTAALAAGATLLVLVMMEWVVQPRLYHSRRSWGILTMLILLALGDALGLVGVLIAPIVALIVQMLIDAFLERGQAFAEDSAEDPLTSMRADLDALRDRMSDGQGGAPVKLSDIATRLDKLLDEAQRATD